jgi:hypothetical protein
MGPCLQSSPCHPCTRIPPSAPGRGPVMSGRGGRRRHRAGRRGAEERTTSARSPGTAKAVGHLAHLKEGVAPLQNAGAVLHGRGIEDHRGVSGELGQHGGVVERPVASPGCACGPPRAPGLPARTVTTTGTSWLATRTVFRSSSGTGWALSINRPTASRRTLASLNRAAPAASRLLRRDCPSS